MQKIYEALNVVAKSDSDGTTKLSAESIAAKMNTLEFICGIVIWHDVLNKINCTNKIIQSSSSSVKISIELLKSTVAFLESSYNQTKFDEYVTRAYVLATTSGLTFEFTDLSTDGVRKKKKFFDEVETNQVPFLDSRSKFKKNFFDILFSRAIKSMKERFEDFRTTMSYFQFLFEIPNISNMKEGISRDNCNLLELTLTDKDQKDISGEELKTELCLLSRKTDKKNPLDILTFIFTRDLEEIFPYTCIALRILLTGSVTVYQGKRFFSKLKLIKNYLRPKISQDKLNRFSIISIESKTTKSLNIRELRLEFAQMKARRVPLPKQ
ncbi:uncharacterized protein LOC136087345 [Hydra vulgaris]|uniref:Uncharacterized protein LOC136087345 n=1 Tax=Hydra vulgaris TaxID=6087 RepID=A0ABM4CVF0_HYDVU